MFARLGAKAVLLVAGVALIFFGVGLVGLGIAAALAPVVGVAWAYAIVGVIFLLPPFLWALAVIGKGSRQTSRGTSRMHPILAILFTAVAKETPWAAIVGASLASAADLFVNRNKAKK